MYSCFIHCLLYGQFDVLTYTYITYGSYIQFPKHYFYTLLYSSSLSCDNVELYINLMEVWKHINNGRYVISCLLQFVFLSVS